MNEPIRTGQGRWIDGLFEARKRYGLKGLNDIVTSNHVPLLVDDAETGAYQLREIQASYGGHALVPSSRNTDIGQR